MRAFLAGTVLVVAGLSLEAGPHIRMTQEPSRAPQGTAFVDPRDGTVYRTVQLGPQLWLGENVRFALEGSWTYGDDLTNEATYGRLYDWEDANRACPPDWHLPTASEWQELFDSLGGPEVAGGCLKEAGTRHWKEPNTGATNDSRFGGLPGGGRRGSAGTFHALGLFGAFWSSTDRGDGNAWGFALGYHYAEVSVHASTAKGFGSSVRCIHD